MTKLTRLTKTDIEGMVHLAKTDSGMEDLLAKALEYYILKGEPDGPIIFRERPKTQAERDYEFMNTRYGL